MCGKQKWSCRYAGSLATWMIISVSCVTYAYLIFGSSIAITQVQWQLVCAVAMACLATGVYGAWLVAFIVGPGTSRDVVRTATPVQKDATVASDKVDRSAPPPRSRTSKSRKGRVNQANGKPPAAARVLQSSITSAFQESRAASPSTAAADSDEMINPLIDMDGGCVPSVVTPKSKQANKQPSGTPRDDTASTALEGAEEAHDETMCQVCRIPRPEGAWHCRVCGVCVLKRDHHCPWIGICVGRFNMVLYKLFLMFACFGSLIPMLIALSCAYTMTRGFENIIVVRDQIVQWYLMYAFGQFASAEAAETWWAEIMSQCTVMLGGARLADIFILLLQCVLSSVVVFGVGFLIIIHILRIPLHRYVHRFVRYVQSSHHEHSD